MTITTIKDALQTHFLFNYENFFNQRELENLKTLIVQVSQKAFSIFAETLHSIFIKPVGAIIQLHQIILNIYKDENFCSYVRSSTFPYQAFTNIDPTLLQCPLSSHLNHRLVISATENEEDFLAACWLLQTIHDTVQDSQQRLLLSGEILAKVVAYRDLQEGRTLPLPSEDQQGKPCRILYRVDRCFNLWKDIPAFGLIPVDRPEASPILLFRGTSFSLSSKGGPASITSNFDPAGSGWVPFQNNKQQIEEWLIASTKKAKARVIGNGLGGSLAFYTALSFPKLISHKPEEPSFAFNPVGVKEELCQSWASLSSWRRPKLQVYVTQGDVISKFGSLFGEVYEIQGESRLYPMAAHTKLNFLRPQVKIFSVDVGKENKSYSRQICQKWQKLHLNVVHRSFQLLLGFFYPISHLTSHVSHEGWLRTALQTTFVARGVLGFF